MAQSRVIFSASALVAVALAGSAAQAFDFRGADLSFGYAVNDDPDLHAEGWTGSASFGLFGNLFGQVDAFFEGYYAPDWNWSNEGPGWGLHLGYEISPAIKVGVFSATQDFSQNSFSVNYHGVEAVFAYGDFEVEAVVGKFDAGWSDYDAVQVFAAYEALPGFILTANYSRLAGEYEDYAVFLYGAHYEFYKGLGLGVELGTFDEVDYDWSFDVARITLDYTFGGGADFGARTYNSLMVAY